jgi:ATP-dependent Clp protease adaptor protein ClpS
VSGITVLPETDISTRTRRQPPYHVIILNDDHHSQQFVVEVLCKVLGCGEQRAEDLMMVAHNSGRAIVWTGALEVAELKADQIRTFHELRDPGNRDLGPLSVEIEPAPE